MIGNRIALRCALALLVYSTVAATAPTRTLARARLALDDVAYSPGGEPTVTFTSSGYPRQTGYIGTEFEYYLEFSEIPGANSTSIFPPVIIGEDDIFTPQTFKLPAVTCSTQDYFIAGFIVEVLTGELVQFTNEVQVVVDRTTCDPSDLDGGQGCARGDWILAPDMWPFPLTPSTQFGDVFDDVFVGQTLFDIVAASGNLPPIFVLGREAVAALLNAQSPEVDYDLSPNEVVQMFNQAAAGTIVQQLQLAVVFAKLNKQGCG